MTAFVEFWIVVNVVVVIIITSVDVAIVEVAAETFNHLI